MTSLSGQLSAGFKTTKVGVDARLAAYKDEGGKCADTKFTVVTADDTSTPQGSLAATQKLVQQDKVDAVLEVSSFFYGAAPWATTTGKSTPVIGAAVDGATQWESGDNNLFPAFPVPDPHRAFTTMGEYLKSLGATRVAGLAFNTPSAKANNENNMKSAEAAGLQRAYVNSSIPYGSTDVGAIVLGIIRSNADAVVLSITPETAFAVAAGLKQANYTLKSFVSPTGYGADLLESAPAVQAGQGITFQVTWSPIELNTAATKKLATWFKKNGVESGIPGFNQTVGWLVTDLYLHALEKTGCDASRAKIIDELHGDTSWDGGGLYPDKFNFATPLDDKQCLYFVKLEGEKFVPDPKASPVCGKPVS